MSDEARRTDSTSPGFPPVAGDLPPGTIVGEYRIEGVAGRGGMGVVYAALQPVIEKKVAIKVLNAQLSSDRELVRRFIDEARAVNRIGHENIIDIFSFGQLPDGRQYFVMEYLEGATLADRLTKGDLLPTDVPTLLVQICEALDAAHAKKIVHRDLKPENVWVGTSSRGRPRVRLLDFGIAKLLEIGDRPVTDIGAVMGTPHYMSPEQCNGRGVDHRTDIYALGVLLYRLFTGKLPIQGETFAEILAKQLTETPPPPSSVMPLPAALDALIVRCLDKDPTARPQSAGELGAELSAIFSLGPVVGSGPSSIGRAALTPAAGTPQSGSFVSSATAPAPAGLVSSTARTALPSSPTVPPPAAPGRSRLVWLVAGAALLGLVGAGWLLLGRGSSATKAPDAQNQRAVVAPLVAPPPASGAREPAPAQAAPVAEPAPSPPSSSSHPARAEAGAGKHHGAPAATPAAHAPASRAASTGLETKNPFE